ncbi:YihY/virulence factor BrkB family protein [Pseudomonas sp. gcc21]|uniref:YihY/virulence factor BrkB family protein n=1 Tax=Pseudomonas sp. gcc21 TaxID=2726989 RepID=UPI0014515EE4|nr:YihY/virulence factor BrkB family protein [Pseudomonas sp. gcc21]QJD58293.1 YihY/virulence factor BrkB family protein [Pseudomonas sp. gcc21]
MAILNTGNIGWGTLAKRTLKEFGADDMSSYSAALAYQALFSIFPFILFLMAMLGFLHLPQFFDWLRTQATTVLPETATEQINPVIDQLQSQDGGLLSFGILIALWTSSAGMRSLMNAMNKAYDVTEARPTWKVFLLSIVYTIGIAIVLLVVAALMIMGPQVMEWLASQVGLQDIVVTVWTWARWPVAIFLMMLVVALLYYIAPNVEQSFRFITPGSVVAVIVWIAASLAFGYYVQNFGNYDATYGSIGAVIVLMLFFYISAAVLLLGAEINAVIEHSANEGKNKGDKKLDSSDQASGSSGRASDSGARL